MVCHWEWYCDWNASIVACGTILISTVTAHLLVSCLFFLFFFFLTRKLSLSHLMTVLSAFICASGEYIISFFDSLTYEICRCWCTHPLPICLTASDTPPSDESAPQDTLSEVTTTTAIRSMSCCVSSSWFRILRLSWFMQRRLEGVHYWPPT